MQEGNIKLIITWWLLNQSLTSKQELHGNKSSSRRSILDFVCFIAFLGLRAPRVSKIQNSSLIMTFSNQYGSVSRLSWMPWHVWIRPLSGLPSSSLEPSQFLRLLFSKLSCFSCQGKFFNFWSFASISRLLYSASRRPPNRWLELIANQSSGNEKKRLLTIDCCVLSHISLAESHLKSHANRGWHHAATQFEDRFLTPSVLKLSNTTFM